MAFDAIDRHPFILRGEERYTVMVAGVYNIIQLTC